MYKFLEQIFGVVFTNKLRLMINDKTKNLPIALIKDFFKSYVKAINEGQDYLKVFLCVVPFMNFFIFSGFFAFIFIIVCDFVAFRLVINKK